MESLRCSGVRFDLIAFSRPSSCCFLLNLFPRCTLTASPSDPESAIRTARSGVTFRALFRRHRRTYGISTNCRPSRSLRTRTGVQRRARRSLLRWTDERRHPWPRKDRVNWIALRLAETEILISRCEVKTKKGRAEKERLEQLRWDCETWMLKVRHGQSWAEIVQTRAKQLHIPDYQLPDVGEAMELRARRACERVDREHPGSDGYAPEPLAFESYCPNCGYPGI
jgi:hypothetical protein